MGKTRGRLPEDRSDVDLRQEVGAPVWRQLAFELRQLILGGRLADGTRLCSVRTLAGQRGVNPATVARAYRELAREGLVRTLRGRGTFVTTGPSRDEEKRCCLAKAAEEYVAVAIRLRCGLKEATLQVSECFRRQSG